jgi:hypothetical protein
MPWTERSDRPVITARPGTGSSSGSAATAWSEAQRNRVPVLHSMMSRRSVSGTRNAWSGPTIQAFGWLRQ